MKKIISAVCLVGFLGFTANAANPDPIPCQNGEYFGRGILKSTVNGSGFPYDVKFVVNKNQNRLASTYTYPNGFTYTLDINYEQDALGFLKLKIGGYPVGTGFCFEKTCRFNVDFTSPTLGPVKASIAYTCGRARITANGQNFSTGNVFEDITQKP